MSVWQTPQATSRTSTSPAFGSASSTSVTFSGCPNSSSTAARILIARCSLGVALLRPAVLTGRAQAPERDLGLVHHEPVRVGGIQARRRAGHAADVRDGAARAADHVVV